MLKMTSRMEEVWNTEEAFVPAAEIERSRKANVTGTEVYIVGQFENSTSAAEDDIDNVSLDGQSGLKIWVEGLEHMGNLSCDGRFLGVSVANRQHV